MRRAQLTRAVFRRNPGGGGGGPVVSGGKLACVADVAALAAFDRTVNSECVAYVESLRDFYRWNSAGVAGTDATNFLTVAAFGGGDWMREGIASQEWAQDYAATPTIFINFTAGNNENPGTGAGAPLKTFSELDRRLHGLLVPATGNFDITLQANLDSADPILVRFKVYETGQFGSIRILGGRSLAASTTITTVQNLTPASNLPVEIVTAASLDAHVGKYVRILNGAAFRCSGWIDKIVTAGTRYRLSSTTNQSTIAGSTANVNPVVGDTIEVYDLVSAPDFLCPENPLTPNLLRMFEVDVAGVGGFSEFATPQNVEFFLVACKLSGAMYFPKSGTVLLDNCNLRPPLGPISSQFAITAGLVRTLGAEASLIFGPPGSPRWQIRTRLQPIFNNCQLVIQGMMNGDSSPLGGITTVEAGFFDVAAVSEIIRLMNAASIVFGRIWGAGNLVDGIRFDGSLNRARFQTTPNVAVTGTQLVMGDALLPATFAALPLAGTIQDQKGNVAISLDSNFGQPGVTNSVVNRQGVALAIGDLVRMQAAPSIGAVLADNTTDANSQVVGAMGTDPANNIAGNVITSGPAVVRFTAAPAIGDQAWLSATPGQAQTTRPAVGVAVYLGTVIRAGITGNRAVVALVRQQIQQQPVRGNYDWDEFLGGSHSSQSIGKMGWGFSNGSWVRVGASPDHPGVMRRTTAAVSGNVADWRLSAFAGATVIRQDQWSYTRWVVMPGESGANDHDARVGYLNDTSADPPTDGVYFERLNTEANWFCVTRAGGFETRTDSGVAYTAATWYKLLIRKNATGGIEFWIDSTLVATHVTDIPAAATGLVEGGHIVPGDFAAKSWDIDFWEEQLLSAGR